ncbi:uncharacterized protein [Amphiura filiformis]|uniref:uncharacterized protein n=1 Tax=Amphiura filiformis TaxID=82378 RepID=UPI003B20EB9C
MKSSLLKVAVANNLMNACVKQQTMAPCNSTNNNHGYAPCATANIAITNKNNHEGLKLLADLNEHLISREEDEFVRNHLIQRNVAIYGLINKIEKKLSEAEEYNRVVEAHVACWETYEVKQKRKNVIRRMLRFCSQSFRSTSSPLSAKQEIMGLFRNPYADWQFFISRSLIVNIQKNLVLI